MVNCEIDYLNPPSIIMAQYSQNGNYYWNGGAFCVNCGNLKGNVTNNGVHPIWHANCKTGCNSTWEDQDAICEDYEYAELMDDEERWREACRDPVEEEREAMESYLEYQRQMDEEYERRMDEEYERQMKEEEEYESYWEEYDREQEELEEGEIAETKEERLAQCLRNQLERDEIEFANKMYEELVLQDQEREQRESGYFLGIACDRDYYNTCDEF